MRALGGNEKHKSTCFDLVRGLLLQLLGIKLGHPALHQRLTTTFINAVQSHASRDLESSLWDDFENVAATLDNVVLVIDGLDELDGDEQETLAMVTCLSNLATTARAGSGTFKIIITSRPMQTEPPANVEKFRIEPELTRSDVSTYISHCIQQLSGTERSPFYRMEDVDRNTIKHQLAERADGMILWAKLVIEEMGRKKSVQQMKKCLDSAPGQLTELYAKLYENLDKSSGDTQKVFHWLLCAQRPLRVDELETVLQVDPEDLSLCKRLTEIMYDLQDACGPLVEITQQHVRLAHHSVRQWILETSNAGYAMQECHKEASGTSLAYLAIILPKISSRVGEHFPTTIVGDAQRENLASLCEDHVLLEYAACFWPVHLQRSMPPRTSDYALGLDEKTRSTFAATHGLSLLEIILWTSYFAPIETKDISRYASVVRLSVHGEKHCESIQNAINNAAMDEASANYDNASILYRRAWLACRSVLGDRSPCTYDCANSYALNLEKAGKGENAEEAYEWMWKSRQQFLGVDHEDTLMIAARLAWLYQRHEHFEKANDTYRQIWEAWVNKSDHFDKHTILAAGYYARALQFVGENEKAVAVYGARMAAAGDRYEKSSQEYIASVIAMAQALEYAGIQTRSESMMRDLSKDLVEMGSGDSKVYASMQLDLELARFYSRQKRASEAQYLLKTRWFWCKMVFGASGKLDDEMIALIEDLARELETQKLRPEALDVVSWLHQYYDRTLGPKSEALLKAMFWMARIFADERRIADERQILQEAYTITSLDKSLDAATLEAARHLGILYYRLEDWTALEGLCKKSLERVWPSVLAQGPPCMLPNDHRPSALSIARQLALSYQKQDLRLGTPGSYAATKLLDKAEKIYIRISDSFQSSVGPQDPNTTGAIVEVGKFYEARKKYDKAQQVFEQVLQSNRTVLGPSHYLTTRSWLKLAQFYERRGDLGRSQQVYEELLQQVSKDWGLSHHLATEISLNLDRIHQRQGRPVASGELRTKPIQEFSGSLTIPHHKKDESNDYPQDLFEDQLKASKPVEGLQDRLFQVQRVYRASLDSSGRLSRVTINHGLRLGNLLEKGGLEPKAIQWYRHMICDGENIDESLRSPVLQYEVVRRLAHLYELEPADLDKAEAQYVRNWNSIKGKKGGTTGDASSLRAFRDLLRFYKRYPTMSEKAVGLLDSTWAELQNGDRSSEHFFTAVETLIHSYISIGAGYKSNDLSRQAVSFLPNGELTPHSASFLERVSRKLGKGHQLQILQLQFEHQIQLGAVDASTIAVTAQELFNPYRSRSSDNAESIPLLRTAYDVWKPKGADNNTTRILGDILLKELDWHRMTDEKQGLLEERWKDCVTMLGLLHDATIQAGKALGKEDGLEEIWNAHKERLGRSDPVTLKVGEDLALCCRRNDRLKTLAIKMYRELFEISWATDHLGPTHGMTLRFGTILVDELCREDEKEPNLLHNRMFLALQANSSKDALALAKYAKLTQSCELQSRYGVGEQPTLQSKNIIKFTMNLSRQVNGLFDDATIQLLDSYATCAKKLGDTDELLAIYEDTWNNRGSQLAWHDRNISKIGQKLAELYFKSGRQIEAIDLISDICRHGEREYGLSDRSTISSYKTKSAFFFERKEYLSALHVHEKILTYYQRNYQTGNFMDMIQQFHQKGRALQRLGRWREARGIYDEAFEMTMWYHGPHGFYVHKLGNIKMWSEKGYEGFGE